MLRDGRETGVPVDVSDAALPEGLDTLDASDCASTGNVEITDGGAGVSEAASGPEGSALLRRLEARPRAVLRRRALLHKQPWMLWRSRHRMQCCSDQQHSSWCCNSNPVPDLASAHFLLVRCSF